MQCLVPLRVVALRAVPLCTVPLHTAFLPFGSALAMRSHPTDAMAASLPPSRPRRRPSVHLVRHRFPPAAPSQQAQWLRRTQRRCTRRLRRLAAVWQAASIWPLRWQQPWLRHRVVTAAASDRHRHRLQPAAPSRRSPAAPTKAAALLNSASLCGIALLARSQPTNARSATRFPFWSLRRSAAPARVARRPRWSSRRATPFRRRPCAPRAGQTRSAKDSALPARLRQAPLAPRAADLEFAPKLCGFRKSRGDFRKRRAI